MPGHSACRQDDLDGQSRRGFAGHDVAAVNPDGTMVAREPQPDVSALAAAIPLRPRGARVPAVIGGFQTKEVATMRASVGSTEASNGHFARVGVLGSMRATRLAVRRPGQRPQKEKELCSPVQQSAIRAKRHAPLGAIETGPAGMDAIELCAIM
jgi:hypothetical protein